jgi:hypothetical protein
LPPGVAAAPAQLAQFEFVFAQAEIEADGFLLLRRQRGAALLGDEGLGRELVVVFRLTRGVPIRYAPSRVC